MAGIENILNIISGQQKQTETALISAAEKKADSIISEGNETAAKEYAEYLTKAKNKLALEYDNAVSSVNAQMKRRVLAYKVQCINEVIEKVIEKLDSLPDNEYFSVLERLIRSRVQTGGVLHLNKKDLARMTDDFSGAVAEMGIEISAEPADIEDGFILSYGLIAENCSFRAIIESERDGVRDTIAGELFRQVKK